MAFYRVHLNWGSSNTKAVRNVVIYVGENEDALSKAIEEDDARLRVEVTSGNAWTVGWASNSPEGAPGWRIRPAKESDGQTELMLKPEDMFIAVRTQEREGFAHVFNGMVLEAQ